MIASLKGYGKIARTLLLTLGCLLVIGIVGSLFLGVRATSQARATAVEQAVAIADNSLALTFEPSDLEEAVSSTRALELTQRIEEVVVDPTDFDEVTLYSPEGLILYSTVDSSIGLQQDGEQDRIREALKGIAQTRRVDGTFQVMLPLRFRSGEGGPAAVQLNRSDTPIAQASGPWNTTAMFLFALLVILSVAVFGVARVLSVVSAVPDPQAAAPHPQTQHAAPQTRMSSPGLREEGEARRRAEERAQAAEQRLNVLQEQYRKALEDLRSEQQAASQRTADPRLEERAIRAEGQLERLAEQVQALTLEREELATELDAAHRAAVAAGPAAGASPSSTDANLEVIGLRAELERAEEQLEMTRREVDLLRGQTGGTSREEFDAMRRELGKARDTVAAAEARAEQAEHEREETRTELRTLRNEEQRAAMLQDELRAAKAEIESFRASHRADLVEREAEFEEKVRATREEFQRQLEDIEGSYRSQLGQRESDLANRITTAETSARAATRELESAKSEVEAARAEAASREQRLLEAADELAAHRGEIATLQQEIQERTLAVSQSRKETEDLKRSIVGLQADLVRADGAVDTMRAELETERARASENEDASAQAGRERRAFEERVQKLTHMLEEAAGENAELNRRLQDFEARRQLELADDAGRAEIDDLLRVTQERLAGQTEKLIAAEDRVKELDAESVSTKEKLDLVEAELRTHQMSEALREMREPAHADAGDATEAIAQPETVEDRRAATPFMKELSNDANKMISRITGISQLLKHKKDSKDQTALLKQLNASTRRLGYTIADIADADKLARGTIELQPKKIDLEALVSRLIEESGIGADHEVRVIADPVKIRVDAQRTEQIIAGLLRNAGERTPGSKSILVRLQQVDDGATISVEDPEPSSDASMSPVVRRFAEVQGGWAKVESREGGGSIFRVHLPNAGGPERETASTSPELQIMVEAPQNGAAEDPWEPTTAEQILSRELRRLAELPSEDR